MNNQYLLSILTALTCILVSCDSVQNINIGIESTTVPVPRSIEHPWMALEDWQNRHASDVLIADEGQIDLLFLGDSITESWDSGNNRTLFNLYFGDYNSANFAIGGDQTQHQIWRLQNGGTGSLNPKLTFLMIGVNNFGHSVHSAQEVFKGIEANIKQIQLSFPGTIIMLHGILPFGPIAGTLDRQKVIEANRLISTLANNETIYFYNFGELFLDDEGNIPEKLMPDFLHPSYSGLELWGALLAPGSKIFNGEITNIPFVFKPDSLIYFMTKIQNEETYYFIDIEFRTI